MQVMLQIKLETF